MSGGFTANGLKKKLTELNDTAPSIQQLSLWIVHHKKHYKTIAETWFKELLRTEPAKKLSFMYLANDVVQNVRKTKPEFVIEFGEKMIDVFNHLACEQLSEKTASSLHRLILIWEERQIFNRKLIAVITSIWKNRGRSRERSSYTPPIPQQLSYGSPQAQSYASPSLKRPITPDTPPVPPAKRDNNDAQSSMFMESAGAEEGIEDAFSENEVTEKNGDMEEELDVSIGDPPDSEELIHAIQELDDAASGDADIRNEIALLPDDVSESWKVSEIASLEDAEGLFTRVKSAITLLEDYNLRLENELRERRRVSRMIYEFLVAQKVQISGLEDRIEIYKDKLDQIRSLEEEVRSHLSSLPDIPSTDKPNPFK
ncbi:regulation of nuclear pre-mRNA domain-containing protein 1B [Eurytemora carolleeae]|uniref:regulation of nuclear pre-mRNA domain-containing protein 1B n=1 Tax=Eurytemora carolleeae TaxID=1294199 RepID=UPI000C788CEF|nr:regulation of nuclear pre-mRNA domain-containing protein 1B [Eurytemora carolleeae]|eukprot:XP_023324029.1 regulation of nuclear pre-mRNA domain-containing protein 1B-like [Eurytemora affinis]